MTTSITNPIGDALQSICNTFARKGADELSVAQSLTAAINGDSTLRDQLNGEANGGSLNAFALGAPANAGAIANSGTKTIAFNKSQIDADSLGDLVFLLGHEAQHLLNAESDNGTSSSPANINAGAVAFAAGINGSNPDYTALINSD